MKRAGAVHSQRKELLEMSGGNDLFINTIENLGKEFQKLLTFLEALREDEQGIETHINALKNCSNADRVTNEILEIKSNWENICKVTENVCKIVNKLQTSVSTEKEVTVENAHSPDLNSEDITQTIIESIDQVEKTKRNFDIETHKTKENKMSNAKENGNISHSNTEFKTENIEENPKLLDDIEENKKCGIRLVPLQKLLSTTGVNSPICEVTISDSDCHSDKSDQDKIFELSDSEGELLQTDRQNEKSTEKLGKKCSQKDEHESTLNITTAAIDAKKSQSEFCESDKNSEIKVKGQIDSSSNTDVTSHNGINRSNKDSTKNNVKALNDCSASLSIGEKANINENIHHNVLKEINNCFQKRCMVRVKRSSLLTATNNKLDQVKQNIKPSGKSAKNSFVTEKRSKSMNSDSESEIENPEQINSNASNSSSESEIVIMRKKRIFQEKAEASSDSSSSAKNTKNKRGSVVRKKRKIISKSNNSSSGDDSNDNGSDDDDDKNRKRKKIRKLINEKNLHDGTKKATKEEEERRKRIEERQKMYNQIYMKPENVEVDELILDFDESTKRPLLKVDDGLLKKLKPHQVNGIKFMWDACFETIKDCQEKPGSGCILAHCMGLGKTMQIVTLAHTLLTNFEVTQVERVLIISPLSTLNNWAREFHHWMNFAKKKDVEVYDMSKFKDKNTRVFKLNEWFTEGGVCIVGYDMYRILSNEKTKGLRKKQKESLQKSLVDPGPDVVVCDEGHLLKNEKTSLSQAVTKMRTKRRIVLTGTPLQNNLKEYYCMIQFIKPNLLGTYKEYLNRFVNPISNGQYTDSTERDIRLMKHRSHILHKMLEACIQRRDYSVLAPYLPPKHEYVVFLTLSEVQKQLYEYYMTTQREIIGEMSGNPGKGAKLFQDFQDLRRIWTHPMNLRMNSDTVIRKKLARYDSDESIKDFIDDNSEESSAADSDSSSSIEAEVCKTVTRNTRATRNTSENETDVPEIPANDDPSEWWVKFVNETELNNINHSPKIVLLMTLLQRCEEIGDKVLVFSQSLQSLDVIEHFLSMIDRKTRGEEIEGDVGNFKGYWVPGVNYFRLDGSRTVENRESMCKSFNNVTNLSARLFLISTRAGGLGINLVAANRVVIFDVSWNPSHDTQSIFRVYRFGQTKPCYIYRLIGLGTMEQKVYERQVAKQATAKRVIDEQQISRHYNQSDLQELYTYELESSTPREIPILPKDRLFAELLSNYEKLIFKYHEHDSLLENEDSENLTEEERKAAWDEYEAEKTRPAQIAMQYTPYDRQAFMSHYGTPSGSVTSNKIFGFRSDILLRLLNMKGAQDHPELTSPQVVQLVPEYLQRLYLEMNNGDPTLYKELLELHKTLEAPGGMYMNPLLFANQTPAPTAITPFGAPIGHYNQVHPGTSTLNSNEVYEVD